MNVHTINLISGHYEISKGVTKSDLEELANNPKTSIVQFSNPLDKNEIELLEKIVFSKRPDISLRIYGHYGKTCDLSFIERIPSLRKISADCLMDAKGIEVVTELKELEELGVGIFNLDNFDFLEKINPTINELYLHQTRSKKPQIESISRFTGLKYLYLEAQQKGIESIRQLKKLQKIVLRSISTDNLDFISELQQLWYVDIKLGGIKNFDALQVLPKIKYLELWQIRDLSDLSFISKLPTLQNLFIQSLKQVAELPDFSDSKSLRRIFLENLKGLRNLSTLKVAPNLREFIYLSAENQQPENLIPILENANIESVFCRFGSNKKNSRFDEIAKQYGKAQYSFNEFQYE
jgi:hypothetical protein